MTATLVQIRPARRTASYAGTLAPAAGPVPLTAAGLGLFDGDPAGSIAPVLQVVVKHAADSGGDLRIGGADSCEYPLAPGESFSAMIELANVLHLRNAGASPATFFVFLFFAE